MNRRGFIAAVIAAPLAALGNFAGNHNVTYQTASISPSEGTWITMVCSQKSYATMFMDIHVSRGGGEFKKLKRMRFENCRGTLSAALHGELCQNDIPVM